MRDDVKRRYTRMTLRVRRDDGFERGVFFFVRHPAPQCGLWVPTFIVGDLPSWERSFFIRHPAPWCGLWVPTFIVGDLPSWERSFTNAFSFKNSIECISVTKFIKNRFPTMNVGTKSPDRPFGKLRVNLRGPQGPCGTFFGEFGIPFWDHAREVFGRGDFP
jgi:hypothetical protein